MCDMRGRGVANDRGKGPEIGNEGDVHCLQNGLSIRDLVLNKDLFYLPFGTLLGTRHLAGLKIRTIHLA